MKRYKVKIIHTIIKEFELTKKNKKEVKKEIDYMKNKTVILEPPYVELKERNKTIIKRKLGSKKYEKNS